MFFLLYPLGDSEDAYNTVRFPIGGSKMSALEAAIQFDQVDLEYYKTQLIQLRHTGELLSTIKTLGINGVTKVQLDAYHDATWSMNMATATYELKTQCPCPCNPLLCAWHGYCCGCFACQQLDADRRRSRLIYDRQDVKEFLRRTELRAQGFTPEQALYFRDTAQSALDNGSGPQMMKVAEELDLMDKKLSAGGAIMANMPMMGGMQMGGMQPMGMQMGGMQPMGMQMGGMQPMGMPMGAGIQPMSPEAAQQMMAQMQGGMQPMQPMGMSREN